MKSIKCFATAMILVFAVMNLETMYAQSNVKSDKGQIRELYRKSDKDIRKEARRLERDAWKSMDLSIEKQLEQTWERIWLKDNEGYPKYIYTTISAVGTSYNAALMQAESVARVRIAGNIGTSITTMTDISLANNEISPQQAVSLSKAVESTKMLVSQELGRLITSMVIYRNVGNSCEVRATVLYDMKQAMEITQKILSEELGKEADEHMDELDMLLGLDKLRDGYSAIELNDDMTL